MDAGCAGRATVSGAFRASVRASVGAAVRASVRASVGTAVRTAVRASVGAAVGASVRTAVVDAGCADGATVRRTFLLVRVLLGVRHVSSWE
ncbi:hypothetical protein [Streptomyces sp. NBC_00233]|uniref:hypothetical protein n=1 Tax=Streptomyces sp. NBC_00233 TaxID=2975686 RepID=UPI002250A3CE|nr:hypothetical protein [Streptomyces sp. NBC_00233]MCX5232726.1 hypothetical protein [Streptomyces sp. NBC_00233]